MAALMDREQELEEGDAVAVTRHTDPRVQLVVDHSDRDRTLLSPQLGAVHGRSGLPVDTLNVLHRPVANTSEIHLTVSEHAHRWLERGK